MPSSPFSASRFLIIFLVCWLLLAIDQVFVLHSYGLPWPASLLDSGINNGLLLMASLLVTNILRYYLPRGEQYVNIFSLCLLLTVICVLSTKGLVKLTVGYYSEHNEMLSHSLPIRFGIGFLLLGCMTMISILWFNRAEQQENDKRKTDAEKLAKEAELFKLRQQLQPHFLFNSLNSINALIGSRPAEARTMVQQLSDFLRGTLKKEEHQWITLREEMQYLELYLDIEKVRFGNRLATNIQLDPLTDQMKLPALLLQPIVENAIKFGLYDTTGDTLIEIHALVENGNLVITVRNPFDEETSSPQQGTGFGLKSVQRRLYLLFARSNLLTTEVKEKIFTTKVSIPQTE